MRPADTDNDMSNAYNRAQLANLPTCSVTCEAASELHVAPGMLSLYGSNAVTGSLRCVFVHLRTKG